MILATTDSGTLHVCSKTPLLEAEKQAHKKTYLKLDTACKLMAKLCDEREAEWDSDERFASEEFAYDYIEAARFLANHFGRTNNRISKVQEWIDSLPIDGKYKI